MYCSGGGSHTELIESAESPLYGVNDAMGSVPKVDWLKHFDVVETTQINLHDGAMRVKVRGQLSLWAHIAIVYRSELIFLHIRFIPCFISFSVITKSHNVWCLSIIAPGK